MKNPKWAIIYGLAVWAIPFVAAMLIFTIRQSDRALFESIMAVVLAATVSCLGHYYFKYFGKGGGFEGLTLGIVWMIISLAIDGLMFSRGPWAMSFTDYIRDIGVTYLMIPAITTGLGYVKKG